MSQTRRFITLQEAQAPFFAGIDLGGTGIKVGVVDDLGRPLSWLSIPTEPERGAEDASARMGAAVKKAIHAAGLEPSAVARVGLGSPGSMDIPAGIVIAPTNLKGWLNFPLRDRVAHHAGLPVSFENDANAAAYGEFWIGSGRDFQSMVLFTLGTGIGCGIIIGDVVVRGAHSHGGECGHMLINAYDDARPCNCGGRGHLEAYASATAVIRRTQELLDAGRPSSLCARIAEGAELTPKLLAVEAQLGDELSMHIILETARYLAIGMVSVMHTLDPEGVLLGGAMTFGGDTTDLGRRFLSRVQEEVQNLAFPTLARETVIRYASLGGDAGFIGAAGVARLEYLQQARR